MQPMAKRRRPDGHFPGALGSGERFANCVAKVSRRADVRDPQALCAATGRRKYGRAAFGRMAARGRARHNPSVVEGYVVVLWQYLQLGPAGPKRTVLYEGTSRASASRTYRDAAYQVAHAKDGVTRTVALYVVVVDERDRPRMVLIDEHSVHGRTGRPTRVARSAAIRQPIRERT